MARVIAICNAKGGVGKTTTAVNVGGYLASLGRRVLLVDFDPQANASSALGHNTLSDERTVYHGLLGMYEPRHIIRLTAVPELHFMPSHQSLAGALVELIGSPEREYHLRRFLVPVKHHYDYILIDLPPSLTLLTINGLLAADEIIVPVQSEYYSLEGIGQLLQMVGLVQKNLKHPIRIAGAVLTMYDRRERLAREVARELRTHFPHRVFKTEIPRAVALAEAPSFAKPVMLYAPKSPGARAYQKLAEEIIEDEPKYRVPPHFGNFNI